MEPLGKWDHRERVRGRPRSRESTDVKLLKSLSSQIEEQDWVTSPVKRRETDDTRSMLPWGSVMGKGMRCVSYPGIAHRAGVTTCDEEGVDVKKDFNLCIVTPFFDMITVITHIMIWNTLGYTKRVFAHIQNTCFKLIKWTWVLFDFAIFTDVI